MGAPLARAVGDVADYLAAAAFVAAQLGVRLGSRIGERRREAAQRVAGAALIALGLFLIAERLLS
ncbi:hypothetical protein [Rugosimonospora africana]|uniref:Uncharacterized protein n=1 Tax=Rugosimonospora africana TaxID=556532 RepID=A0A8J3VUI4_9ACTN|nr:hypothetical protein [Rugosimonospora africana]GIH19587.1 hypothetical protein Raf01_77590 [Rugosimonospora africana]